MNRRTLIRLSLLLSALTASCVKPIAAGAASPNAPTPTTATHEASHMSKPFTLVYAGAITRNEPGKVNIHPVTYALNGLDIAANVCTPANYDPERALPSGRRGAAEENAFARATGTKDKQLFKIGGAPHIETYWVEHDVDSAMNELTRICARTIGACV